MVKSALKAAPPVRVVLVQVARDEEGNPHLRHKGMLYDTLYEGKLLVRMARFPFYASARKLKELGCGDDDVISMRWAHEPHTTSMAGRIGYVATRVIEESAVAGPKERGYEPFAVAEDRLKHVNDVKHPVLP